MVRRPEILCTLFAALLAFTSLIAPLRAQNDPASRRAAIEAMYPVMIQALESRNFGYARHICDQAILWEPQNPVHHYNLACIEAKAGGARLPYALGALELAVALGFNDANHLQTDPDLVLLRDDPKFQELVRKALGNANPLGAFGPSTKAGRRTAGNQPPAATVTNGVPIGLFFVMRSRWLTRSAEKTVWYFAPDGAVYQNPEVGFGADELAAHRGRKGTAKLEGGRFEVTWSDGKKARAELKSTGDSAFTWDGGQFIGTAAPRREDLAGVYELVETLGAADNSPPRPKRLELRADGTFVWSGATFPGKAAKSAAPQATGEPVKGGWELHGSSLVFTLLDGAALRCATFPCDDPKTPAKPDWLYVGGTLYRRR